MGLPFAWRSLSVRLIAGGRFVDSPLLSLRAHHEAAAPVASVLATNVREGPPRDHEDVRWRSDGPARPDRHQRRSHLHAHSASTRICRELKDRRPTPYRRQLKLKPRLGIPYLL